MEKRYNKTIISCFIAYIVQAIVNNFVPLLFLMFQETYNITLFQVTLLITINFGIQLLVDVLSIYFIDKIGYRKSMILAHFFSMLGFLLLVFLPDILTNSFIGILISVSIYAIGGGILEVLVSPIVESCPTENKEKSMSLLHSFYCWGHVGVVLLSTVFFNIFGINNWKIIAIIWASIPLINGILFIKVPILPLIKDEDKGMNLKELVQNKIFWVLLIMMVCAGASEQALSQWASTIMEKSTGLSKTITDLAGPMTFAILMGISRLIYGKYGDKINLDIFMIISSVLAIISYIGVSFFSIELLSFVSCGLCGFSVGIMWPGVFSKASSVLKNGGTAMFALLALGGDLGCSLGPTLVGFVSGTSNDNLSIGILVATCFPIILLIGIIICITGKRKTL